MVKGLIDFLLDKNEHAQYLRDTFTWKIVPMLNPDGVINGNHRCGLSAKDLNREFINPDRVLNPTVWYFKEMVRHIKQNGSHWVRFICLDNYIYSYHYLGQRSSSKIFLQCRRPYQVGNQ
jgi:hypothetical protein